MHSIGSGNALNIYLNPMIHGSIPTEGKNSTSERSAEDREVTVLGPPKVVGTGLLQLSLCFMFYS
jgi:hypothetical protein